MKKNYIILLISIFLLTGCGNSNNPTILPNQTENNQVTSDIADESAIQEEIKTKILSDEYPPAEVELVLITSSDEHIDCSIHSVWSETPSIFLTECYYMIPVIKDVMYTHGYNDIRIGISSQNANDSGKIRRLTYKSDSDISLLDSSNLEMYTYEQLNILGPSQEVKAKKNQENKTIASGSYDITGETFQFSDSIINDITGKWRLSLIASSKDTTEYAIDYYNTLFNSNDEIHAIVNFSKNTTTKISVLFDEMLDVTVYEYVDKEEHDANLLFSGMLLKEYWINIESGEIEIIQ